MTHPAMKPSMRAWHGYLPGSGLPDSSQPRPDIFLVDCGPSEEAIVSGHAAELDEEPWREPHDYAVVDRAGRVSKQFATQTWAIDDDLGASVYAIVGDALVNLTVTLFCSSTSDASSTRKEMRTVVDGLRPIDDLDERTRELLSRAIAKPA
jgi:hypothetical protein